MKNYILLFFISIICLCSNITKAQEVEEKTDTTKIDKKIIYKAAAYTSIYYVGSIYFLSNTWYKDKEKVPFHFYNDNEGYLQVDKFGHMFGSYLYSYIG